MKQLLRYVNPQGPLPEIKGQGDLLIIGSAACVWDDLRKYDQRHSGQDRMAINDMMGYYQGRLQWGATLHGEKLPGWAFGQWYRSAKEGFAPMRVHSHRPADGIKHVWHLGRDGGTSGLFGVLIGLLMGYENIILAGITCDGSPRFFDPPWQTHSQFNLPSVHDEWKRARDAIFRGRVKSLSGNTAKWLGEPEFPDVPQEPRGLSIIIPAWKSEDFLRDCLESLAAQTYFSGNGKYEILLGVDACESTKEAALRLASAYKNLKVFWFPKNGGPYLVRNSLSKEAKFDNLLFFDADDQADPEMVQLIMERDDDVTYMMYRDDFKFQQTCGVFFIRRPVFYDMGGLLPWRCAADS